MALRRLTSFVSNASIKGGKLVLNNAPYFRTIIAGYEDTEKVRVIVEREASKRTEAQNRALHLYLSQVADELNAAGYTLPTVLEKRPGITFTPEIVKETLWRPLQKALVGKESTTTLNKGSDIDGIYEHLNRFLGEEFGVHVPFPQGEGVRGVDY